MSKVIIPPNVVKLIRLPASCLNPKLVGLGPHYLPITYVIWEKFNKKIKKEEYWRAFIMGDGQVVYSHKEVASLAAAERQTIFYAGMKAGKMAFDTRKHRYLVDPDNLTKVKRTALGKPNTIVRDTPSGFQAGTEPFTDHGHTYQWAQSGQHLLLLEVA